MNFWFEEVLGERGSLGGWGMEEGRPLGIAAGFSCGWDYLQLVRILEDKKLFFHILRVIQSYQQ